MRRLLLLIAALFSAAAAPVPAPDAGRNPDAVDYRVTPEFAAGQLTSLQVEVRFQGDADGETTLDLPGLGADGTERWRLLSDLAIAGGDVWADGDVARILTHAARAPLVVRYRVRSAYPPESPDENPPLKGPMLRPGWFMAPGFIFAVPRGRDAAPATFAWGPLPVGWAAASNLDHGAAGQPMTVQDVFDGVLVGGQGLAPLTRRIPGSTLRVAVLPGDWRLSPDDIANALARVIVVQRRFWGDIKTPFFVSVTPMAPTPNRGSVGGFGRWQGFALFAATNSERGIFEGNIAHEHTHAWIPTRIGRAPNGRAQVAQFWLSEGFSDFFGDRTLLRFGVWRTPTYVAALNRVLERYGTSPIRNVPNSAIVESAFRDPAFTHLPYDRGRLLAILWDRRITRATDGRRRLDNVVFAMRDRYLAAPPADRPGTVENLVRTYRDLSGGLDLSDDITRYVVQGETVVLPRGVFAPCRVVTVRRGDQSFQRVAPPPNGDWSACAGRMSGLSITRR